jgi:glutamate-5-semialdehyde dehydrogenase
MTTQTITTQAITTRTMEQAARSAREASRRLRTMPAALRDAALRAIAREIDANRLTIQAANARDLERARADGIPQPLIYRLGLSDRKMAEIDASLQEVAAAPDPLQHVQVARQLDEGLTLTRVAVPIGVLGVIFESRPDALVQIASLCIKSGNAAILKGGSEAAESNRALFDCIQAALAATDPRFAGALHLATSRDQIDDLLRMDDLVDLIIPRGSPELVRSIQDRTRIAVLGHADGICHVYVDAAADLEQALAIVVDAKTEYPAVCNAAETVLVHADVAGRLLPRLREAVPQVELRGDERVRALIDVAEASEADWDTEYLDLILAVRIVDDLQEAIAFINRHGSGHTDAIVTTDRQAADAFFAQVDSASVLCNCSTRFADGYRFGLGAEVGISTTRIHARGPVGVEGLTTYAYRLQGDGHVVADYTSGARSFHHRDLPAPSAATGDGRT